MKTAHALTASGADMLEVLRLFHNEMIEFCRAQGYDDERAINLRLTNILNMVQPIERFAILTPIIHEDDLRIHMAHHGHHHLWSHTAWGNSGNGLDCGTLESTLRAFREAKRQHPSTDYRLVRFESDNILKLKLKP